MKKNYKADTAIESFADAVNILSSQSEDVKEASKTFVKQHRTLQQSMTCFVADVIHEVDKIIQENPFMWTDLRNQAASEWIHKVAQIERYFPLI